MPACIFPPHRRWMPGTPQSSWARRCENLLRSPWRCLSSGWRLTSGALPPIFPCGDSTEPYQRLRKEKINTTMAWHPVMFVTSWLHAAVVQLVPAGLHHVDLPGGGEAPVDVGHRHQPQRGPDPVSQGQPRAPLNTTKTKTELWIKSVSQLDKLNSYTNSRVKPGELNWLGNIFSWTVTAEMIFVVPNVARMLWVLQWTKQSMN